MIVITLCTDLGLNDHYVAAVKAAILRMVADVQIVDISHGIPSFNIGKAAFVLGNVWRDFPEGTIHIIGVDAQSPNENPWVAVKYEDHLFIGADNGLFSLLFGPEASVEIHLIQADETSGARFPTREVLVPAAAALAKGAALLDLGPEKSGYRVRLGIAPVVGYDNIRGSVIYVDGYGNVITNITRELFENVIGRRNFHVVLRRGDRDIHKISQNYGDVQEGEKLALFTTGGLLEIAINKGVEGSGGSASSLLGLREGDVVRVEFDPEQA